MPKLSDRVNKISESQTIAMARKSRELKAAGVDIISLSLGEPDFHTPQIIKDAAKKAIDSDFSYYTHVSGYLELREAVCKKFKRDYNLRNRIAGGNPDQTASSLYLPERTCDSWLAGVLRRQVDFAPCWP